VEPRERIPSYWPSPTRLQRRTGRRDHRPPERRGLRIVGMKLVHISRPLAEKKHYASTKASSFYEGLVDLPSQLSRHRRCVRRDERRPVVRATIGSTGPGRSCAWHDPRRFRPRTRPEPGPCERQPRECDAGDQTLLQAVRTRGLEP